MAKAPRTSTLTTAAKTAAQKLQPTPAAQTEDAPMEPKVVIAGPQSRIHGKLVINLYQGDFRLAVHQDSTMNTFVVYHKDDVIGLLRAHRRSSITTYGLHISAITRLAVNVSEEAAANYVSAALFFDNHLRAFAIKQPQIVDLQYTYEAEDQQHTGYIFIAGRTPAFDDFVPDVAHEIICRSVPYINNFCERYAHTESESDRLLTALSTEPFKW